MIARAAPLLALCLAGAAQAAPLDSVPESGRLAFAVWREGARIGSHTMEFRRDGDAVLVESRIEVTVRLAFITLYRYSARLAETWRGGSLAAYEAETDDDGTLLRVSARATREGILVEGAKGGVVLPPGAMAFTLWSRAIVEGAALFATDTGTALKEKIEDLGASPVPGAGPNAAAARHYRLTGDLAYELWFAGDGVLAGALVVGRDGSIIEYRAE